MDINMLEPHRGFIEYEKDSRIIFKKFLYPSQMMKFKKDNPGIHIISSYLNCEYYIPETPLLKKSKIKIFWSKSKFRFSQIIHNVDYYYHLKMGNVKTYIDVYPNKIDMTESWNDKTKNTFLTKVEFSKLQKRKKLIINKY